MTFPPTSKSRRENCLGFPVNCSLSVVEINLSHRACVCGGGWGTYEGAEPPESFGFLGCVEGHQRFFRTGETGALSDWWGRVGRSTVS